MFKNLLFFILIHNLSLAQVSFLQNRKCINLEYWTFQKGKLNDVEKFSFLDNDWEKVKVPHTYSMDAIVNVGYYKG